MILSNNSKNVSVFYYRNEFDTLRLTHLLKILDNLVLLLKFLMYYYTSNLKEKKIKIKWYTICWKQSLYADYVIV